MTADAIARHYEFGSPAGSVDVEEVLDAFRGVLAQLGAELRGPVPVRLPVEVEDTNRDQVVEQPAEGRRRGSGCEAALPDDVRGVPPICHPERSGEAWAESKDLQYPAGS